MIRYNYDTLEEFVNVNHLTLINDYSSQKINRDLVIEGNCKNNDCSLLFSKSFRNCITYGCYCKLCTLNINKQKPIILYTYELLIKICNENNIILSRDYSTENVNVFTIIEGNCLTNNCTNKFNKHFRSLFKTNGYCHECSTKTGFIKNKKTCMEKYNVEYPTQCPKIKDKTKQTIITNISINPNYKENIKNKKLQTNNIKNTIDPNRKKDIADKFKATVNKHNIEHPDRLNNINEKNKYTCLLHFGVEHPLQAQEIKEKCKQTCITHFGCEYPMQSDIVKNKSKQKCMTNFGVEFSLQSQEIRDKGKITCFNKYGVEHYSQCKEFKDSVKQTNIMKNILNPNRQQEIINKNINTCIKKYGVEFSFQSEEIKDKIKQTNLQKYGVENVMHLSEFSEKSAINSYRIKKYTFPSGNIINVQGYENWALDELLRENVNENDIIVSRKLVPEIWYLDDQNNKHRHYVDIFIPSQNKCIEVKSTWTFEIKNDTVMLKQQAGKLLGYEYEIWMYNNKGIKLNVYK
jgi:hypothetical protein